MDEKQKEEENKKFLHDLIRIKEIKNLRNNNLAITKMKKQIDIKRNLENIYKEIERKSLIFEKKLMESNFSPNEKNTTKFTNPKINKDIDIGYLNIKENMKVTLPKLN